MPPKRKDRDHIDIPRDLLNSSTPALAAPGGGFLRETARLGVDGRIRHEVKILPIPASLRTSTSTTTPSEQLHLDEVRPFENVDATPRGPVFDLYEQEQADVAADDDDEGRRDLRDSVRLAFYTNAGICLDFCCRTTPYASGSRRAARSSYSSFYAPKGAATIPSTRSVLDARHTRQNTAARCASPAVKWCARLAL
jgi:hypothetical protein